ncbi:MAG: PorV/PorQ family protein [Elusimicrobia bacterium]|nr:PorV/PorQ family protein [Elusimicrobiota bacterium]
MRGKLKWVWIPAFAGMTMGIAASLWAETQSGLSFLKIGVGARPIGLGGAYTAMAHDATALYWNPAGLSSLSKKEISAMHSEWLLGSNFDFLGIGYPSKIGTLGFGVSMLSQPQQEGRDAQGRKTSDFSARDSAFSLALGRRLSLETRLGLGLKLIQSRIGAYQGQGFALDLGAMRHLQATPLSFGLAVQNLGPGIKFIEERTKLPLTLSSGLGYHAFGSFVLAADIKYRVYDKKTIWAMGTEYGLGGSFALRAGYSLTEIGGRNSLSGLGAGFGLKIAQYRLDYSMTPFGELGDTHRVSLGARW